MDNKQEIVIKVPVGVSFTHIYNALAQVFKIRQDSTPTHPYAIIIDDLK